MNNWVVSYQDWKPELQPLREALCTLGNGYIAIRGAFEEARDNEIHYPGTYLAGGYNRLESKIAGEVIENEDFVNWPNWLSLSFKPRGGQWLDLQQMEVMHYDQQLDLKKGILIRNIQVKDTAGRITTITSKRFVHMRFEHLAGVQWKLNPENWSGEITIKSAIDGKVINNNVARYRDLRSDHLHILEAGQNGEDAIFLSAKTTQSQIKMTQSVRTCILMNGKEAPCERLSFTDNDHAKQEITLNIQENHPITVEKIASIYTSRDSAISEPQLEACKVIQRVGSFEQLLHTHQNAWSEIWKRCDIQLKTRDEDQRVLRLHIFHLLQTTSLNTVDLDVGVPSRGLHGEAYRGHILWDELFIFPILNFSYPEITRSLLMYRYRRLPEAREAAKNANYQGAMYPWQSGSDGREESQEIHLNPQSGNWIPDNTYLQRHVNLAIAYNIWQYYQVSKDIEFLSFYGAEMFLDISKFWGSKTSYNKEKGRFEILNVVGPDEYHTRYPDSEQPGLNNNSYTNVMAVWLFIHAKKIIGILHQDRKDEILKNLSIDEEEMQRWDKISKNMFVPFLEDHIIAQFEGFADLKELDWQHYHQEYGEILRLDRIMEKEEDRIDRYKASKQADVLMLFYLLSAEELKKILNRLDYDFETKNMQKNIDYYEKRTSHGSTLSKLVHSWVMARSNRRKSWHNFQKALMSDFKDIQGGTTHEGIHLGAMAGTVDLIQRCYTGLEVLDDELRFNPTLPDEVEELSTRLRYQGHWLLLTLNHEYFCIRSDGGWSKSVTICFNGECIVLGQGEEKTFYLKKAKQE